MTAPSAAPAPILADPNPGLLRALLHGAYDLVWLAAIVGTAPWWLLRSLRDARFRTMVHERLALDLPARAARPRVLVHGVSVGEVKGAAPLVHALQERHPELEVVISTTTYTGVEVARRTFPGLHVVRFPLDLSPVVRRFLARIDPLAVVLIELEIWPNFLRECNRAGLPVAVVNGRITARSYKRYRLFRRALPQFSRISLFSVQLEEYAQRFRALGGAPERVLVTGNLKADGLRTQGPPPGQREELVRLLGGAPEQAVVVAGSTHAPEERLLVDAWRAGAPGSRLVLVPRHPPRCDELARELEAAGAKPQRLSRLRAGEAPDPRRVALVDTIGELDAIYSLADVVFVGGSLVPHGGQNVLEPAALGRPVLHGPHVDNFRQEVALLQSAGASREVPDARSLQQALRELLADAPGRARMGAAGQRAVQAQRGATTLTLDALTRRCLAHVAPPVHAARR